MLAFTFPPNVSLIRRLRPRASARYASNSLACLLSCLLVVAVIMREESRPLVTFAACSTQAFCLRPTFSLKSGHVAPNREFLATTLAASQTEEGISAHASFWSWQNQNVHYLVSGPKDGDAVLLIHGFGVTGLQYRRTSAKLASEGYRVYALDLLGFGFSSKPGDVTYSLDLWEKLVVDFCVAFSHDGQPWVLGGNSIGGMVALGVASNGEAGRFGGVRGLLLLNCAAGMNNKFLITSYRTSPFEKVFGTLVFSVVDLLLAQDSIAQWGFEKLATKDTVADLLTKVYVNAEAVDDELVDGILAAARDEGALGVFVKCLSGDPGIPPEKLVDRVRCPVKMIWGDRDTLTPLGVGYGNFFRALAKLYPSQWSLSVVPAGHCPHDDAPDAVHAVLLPWLAGLPLEAAAQSPELDVQEVLKLSFEPEVLERFDNIPKLKI